MKNDVCKESITHRFVYSHLTATFSAPYFVTLLQFISPTLALFCYSKLNEKYRWSSSFPHIQYVILLLSNIRCSISLIKKVFPLSLLFCATVTMSNLCLKYVEVSFYQISRSLGIPFVPVIKFETLIKLLIE